MPGPFNEGPVEISYEDSNGKQKVTIVMDFGVTKIRPSVAAKLMLDIVRLLRQQLSVGLDMFNA